MGRVGVDGGKGPLVRCHILAAFAAGTQRIVGKQAHDGWQIGGRGEAETEGPAVDVGSQQRRRGLLVPRHQTSIPQGGIVPAR